MRSPPGAADDEDELDDEPVDPDPEPEPVEDDLDDDLDDEPVDEDSGRAETVVCHDCGSEIPRDDAGMDLVDGSTVWICSGGCDSDELVTDGGIPRDQEIDYPRSLDELPPEYDPRYWEAVEDADRVRCNGIESAVLDEDREEIGHVLMLDYDDVGRQTVMREAEDLDGLSVVVESSTGSYHVYGLSVRSWESAVETARESSASESYVDEMDRRGEFTLRVSGKGDEPAPTVVGISGRGSEDSDLTAVSDPHLSVLQDMATDEFALTLRAVRAGLSDSHEPVGSTAVRSTYETEVDR